ncbi:MAG: entericidin A/B family lipoprotein [Rubricella sp.]
MKAVRPFLFLVLFAGLAACNTIEGIGEDVQDAGRAIEGAAQ